MRDIELNSSALEQACSESVGCRYAYSVDGSDVNRPSRGRLGAAVRLAALVACSLALGLASPRYALAVCGDADGDDAVVASDALIALRGAVGLDSDCRGNCDCDVNGDRRLTAGDALAILRGAVGDGVDGCNFFADYCFKDSDCDPGYWCGADPDWTCDAACVPE